MDEEIVQQIIDELLSSLEPLDTQTAGLLQFLKAKGIVTDEELAPYLEQAGNASNVRWLATRVRIRSLISSAMKAAEQPAETEATKTTPKSPEPAGETTKETARKKESDEEPQRAAKNSDNSKPGQSKPAITDDQNKNQSRTTKPDEVATEDAKPNAKPDAA
jgi:hypothetical protein